MNVIFALPHLVILLSIDITEQEAKNLAKKFAKECIVGQKDNEDSNTKFALLLGGVRVEAMSCNLDFNQLKTKLNNLRKDQLNSDTLLGAKKELAGGNSGIWNDPNSANFGQEIQHLTKARNAKTGLESTIGKINSQLNNNKNLTQSEIKELNSLKNSYQSELDRINLEVPGL